MAGKVPCIQNKMATTVLGFRFVDESFFNCEVPAANWRRMRDGKWQVLHTDIVGS